MANVMTRDQAKALMPDKTILPQGFIIKMNKRIRETAEAGDSYVDIHVRDLTKPQQDELGTLLQKGGWTTEWISGVDTLSIHYFRLNLSY